MKCPNCKTELTLMKEAKCLRCLKCHPLTKTVPVEKKETNYVDVPWTAERIWDSVKSKVEELIREELENWHSNIQEIDELPPARVPPRQLDNWRAKAKELGVDVYDKARKRPRLKIDVLKDIEEKLTVPA